MRHPQAQSPTTILTLPLSHLLPKHGRPLVALQRLIDMPPILPLLHLIQQPHQRHLIVATAQDLGLERLLAQPLPVLRLELQVEPHGAVQRARVQVPVLRAVVADAEGFFLAAGLGARGAGFDEGEDAVVALCERREERVEGLHVLDCGEGLERALRAV